MLHLSCPTCKKTLRVRDDLRGKKIQCPQCKTLLTAPAAAAPVMKTPTAGKPLVKKHRGQGRIWLVIVGVCVFLFAATAITALLGALSAGHLSFGPTTAGKPYTHKQLNDLVMGASADDVRARIGGPDQVMRPLSEQHDGNEGYWLYNNLTTDETTGKPDKAALIWFTRGRCDQLQYTP